MRVFALSDIHIDYPDNMTWIRRLSEREYREDALVLAGDATHDMDRLETALTILKRKFAAVFFVPGNHELWIMDNGAGDSLQKFHQILKRCDRLGIETRPRDLDGVRIVPLFSWYTLPEEGEDSLFLPKKGEDPSLKMWSDHYFVRWPRFPLTPTAYFLGLNKPHLTPSNLPVISFSHFLPRVDLIFDSHNERQARKITDENISFNFSRVAGSTELDRQIRMLGSVLHVYGHQHRNRFREVDGIIYVSHCLGYGYERKTDKIRYIGDRPRLIWDDGPVGEPERQETREAEEEKA